MKTTSEPNREALKQLLSTQIDAGAAQQVGIPVFNGQSTPAACAELKQIADDIIAEVTAWKAAIPA